MIKIGRALGTFQRFYYQYCDTRILYFREIERRTLIFAWFPVLVPYFPLVGEFSCRMASPHLGKWREQRLRTHDNGGARKLSAQTYT